MGGFVVVHLLGWVLCVLTLSCSVSVTAEFSGAENDENQSKGICLYEWVCGRLVCKEFCRVVQLEHPRKVKRDPALLP